MFQRLAIGVIAGDLGSEEQQQTQTAAMFAVFLSWLVYVAACRPYVESGSNRDDAFMTFCVVGALGVTFWAFAPNNKMLEITLAGGDIGLAMVGFFLAGLVLLMLRFIAGQMKKWCALPSLLRARAALAAGRRALAVHLARQRGVAPDGRAGQPDAFPRAAHLLQLVAQLQGLHRLLLRLRRAAEELVVVLRDLVEHDLAVAVRVAEVHELVALLHAHALALAQHLKLVALDVAVAVLVHGLELQPQLLEPRLVLLGVLCWFDAALTLPGIAGVVLTIGMAVDANVLIFERIREELAGGAALRMAIRNGFGRATRTIVDANLTTLITAIVLYVIGKDQLRGFAVTLILGIGMSMFTAIFCSRVISHVL